MIDGNIKVTITRIQGSKVRVGIEAPRHISVVRSELLDDRGNTKERNFQ